MKDSLGVDNPFRYRSYYFDNESGFYYLQSRYYSPDMGRFINGDDRLVDNGNMFAYCGNNPVVNVDPTGHAWWNAVWNSIKNTVTNIVNSVVRAVRNVMNASLPSRGEPDSRVKSEDGTIERQYDDEGNAYQDKHNTDHGNSKEHPHVPHGHDWGLNDKGKWEPDKPGYPWDGWKAPYNDISINTRALGAGLGLLVVGVVIVAVVAIDDSSGIGVADDPVGFSFGGGLVIKAVTVLQEVVVFKELIPAY